jgi:hypothetical protein
MPGSELLVSYLKEYGVLDKAGGEGYIKSVFQGLELGGVL